MANVNSFRSSVNTMEQYIYINGVRMNYAEYKKQLKAKEKAKKDEKKAKRAPKSYKNRLHYVRPGESMYTISQYYAIRLKYLYKLNRLTPDDEIRVGQGLKVR